MRTLKILFLAICSVLISCTDDIITEAINETAFEQENEIYLFPPDWIIGNWYSEIDSVGTKRAILFKENDVIETTLYSSGYKITESLNSRLNEIFWSTHNYLLLEETKTDSTYFISMRKGYTDTYNRLYEKMPSDSLIRIFSSEEQNYILKFGRRD